MKCTAGFLMALSIAGCSTNRLAPRADVDSPKVIYAVSQSEAFAMAQQALASAPRYYTAGEYQIDSLHDRDATHDQLIGYRLVYRGWSAFHSFTQNLYVIPVAGVGAGGQEISGFRFLISAAGPKVGYAFVRASAQDRSLANTLNAALDSTGTTTPVTNLRRRPYDEANDR